MSWHWKVWTKDWLFRMWPYFSRSLQTFIDMRIQLNYRRIFFLLLGLGATLYILPVMFRKLRGARPMYFPWPTGCLQERLEMFKSSVYTFDSSLHYDEVESNYFPFTGNGYIALGVSEVSSRLLIRQGRVFEAIPYFPLVDVKVVRPQRMKSTAATVMDFKSGTVHLLQSFGTELDSRCLQIDRKIVAHRRIPNLLIETLDLYNALAEDVEISFSLQKTFAELKEIVILNGGIKDSEVISGVSESKASSERTLVVLIRSTMSSSNKVLLKTGARHQIQLMTVINYYALPPNSADYTSTKNKLIEEVRDMYKVLQQNSVDTLLKGHALVWANVWTSGFSISYSRAVGAYNGDKINATVYYGLCFERSLNQEIKPSGDLLTMQNIAEAPQNPGHCYAGHSTLLAGTLWSDFRSVEEIIRVAGLWRLTLVKKGCGSFLALGAQGFLQAFVLSLGGFRYSNYDHLEMVVHPRELHRNYDFRRVAYGNDVHLNISVRVGEETDNKPVLFVAVDRSDKTFYACDAGCLDPPVQLTAEMQEFPVKLTEPLTAILYITKDKQHMEELKHTLHLQNIHDADPHPHHVLAEHKHGHDLGGLPILFWVGIGLLVALFHVFLIRIVVNEYFNQDKVTYAPVKRPSRYTA